MIQAIIVKAIIGKIMDAIEKADDKRIASNHDARITRLEKIVIYSAGLLIAGMGTIIVELFRRV